MLYFIGKLVYWMFDQMLRHHKLVSVTINIIYIVHKHSVIYLSSTRKQSTNWLTRFRPNSIIITLRTLIVACRHVIPLSCQAMMTIRYVLFAIFASWGQFYVVNLFSKWFLRWCQMLPKFVISIVVLWVFQYALWKHFYRSVTITWCLSLFIVHAYKLIETCVAAL